MVRLLYHSARQLHRRGKAVIGRLPELRKPGGESDRGGVLTGLLRGLTAFRPGGAGMEQSPD